MCERVRKCVCVKEREIGRKSVCGYILCVCACVCVFVHLCVFVCERVGDNVVYVCVCSLLKGGGNSFMMMILLHKKVNVGRQLWRREMRLSFVVPFNNV